MKNLQEPDENLLAESLSGTDDAYKKVAGQLRSDPVTVARVLENSFDEILHRIRTDSNLVGPVKLIWSITEVQGRKIKHIYDIIQVVGAVTCVHFL